MEEGVVKSARIGKRNASLQDEGFPEPQRHSESV